MRLHGCRTDLKPARLLLRDCHRDLKVPWPPGIRGPFDPANELVDCTVLSYSEINRIVRQVGNRWCWINVTA